MTRIEYIAICDTHNALFAEGLKLRYLDGLLLSSKYIYSEPTAQIIFDSDFSITLAGSLKTVINLYQNEHGDKPWLICEKCAEKLAISKEDIRRAKDSARKRLSDTQETGHFPAFRQPDSKKDSNLSVTYSSHLIPTDIEMATLTTFYDQVWLPHPCDLSPYGAKNVASLYRELQGENFIIPDLQKAQVLYAQKLEKWKLLIEEGILKIMPQFHRFESITNTNNHISLNDYFGWFKRLKESKELVKDVQHLESLVLAMHRLDAKKIHPEIFVTDSKDTSTLRLSGLLNHATLAARIPMLNTLNAQQILDIKVQLKPTRSGYINYLSQLTDDIEQRLESRDYSEFIAAQKTAERRIIPEYNNYVAVLKSKEASNGSKVLEATGKFMQVEASLWTPKFWGALIESISVIVGNAAKQDCETYLSNENQAFLYLASIESAAKAN